MPNSQPAPLPFSVNDKLLALYVDAVFHSSRKDGINLLRFTTNLPEGPTEQVRLMLTQRDLKNIINILCSSSGYYPKQPVETVKRSVDLKES